MKRTLTMILMFCLILSLTAIGSTPTMINYQGRLTDETGEPVKDFEYVVRFSIYDAPFDGNLVWTEDRTVATRDGLFSLLLGSVNPINDSVFRANPRYLAIRTDGGELTPRTMLVTIPWAFRVNTVDGATGGTISGDVDISGKATIGTDHTNTGAAAFVAGKDNITSGESSTVSGGRLNNASARASNIGGGMSNTASFEFATVGGGGGNQAGEAGSVVSGGLYNGSHGAWSVVAGGGANWAADTGAVVSGGKDNQVQSKYSTIAGGLNNSISAGADYSYLFGLNSDLSQDSTFMVDLPHIRFGNETDGYEFPAGNGFATQRLTTDGSGQLYWANPANSGWSSEANKLYLSIQSNLVGLGTTTPSEKLEVTDNIWLYDTLKIGTGSSLLSLHHSTGLRGVITTTSGELKIEVDELVVSGKATIGENNSNNGVDAFCAGTGNSVGDSCVVSGGVGNSTSGRYATVGGGRYNLAAHNSTVGGGAYNDCSGQNSAIGGGSTNEAAGNYATVPGGSYCKANGNYSFAAGRGGRAVHEGSFVWADASNQSPYYLQSGTANEFMVRASGGVRFYTNAGASTGVFLSNGAMSWGIISDSTIKRDIREVDYSEVLAKVAELPISQWGYKAQEEGIEHIGPMAQDFYRLFGLGSDDKKISTIDPDGVALAAIKALNEKNEQLENLVEQLQKRLEKIENESSK